MPIILTSLSFRVSVLDLPKIDLMPITTHLEDLLHPRENQTPLLSHPGLVSGLDEIDESVRRSTHHLLGHTTFVSMYSQSREDIDQTDTAASSMGGGRE